MGKETLGEVLSRNALYLPFSTIVKVLLVLLFVSCLKVLSPLLMTLFLSILLAVSLTPVIDWLQHKGLNRAFAVGLVTVILAGSIVAVVALIVPKVFDEFSSFVSNLPKLKTKVLNVFPPSSPFANFAENGLSKQAVLPQSGDIGPIFSAGNVVLSGFAELVLIFVFSIYLVVDGNGVIAWFSAFFDAAIQAKIRQTGDEISPIIFSYVAGQLITSVLSFFYVLIALAALHVPSALLLATLAGAFDVLPVLGFFLAVIPALIFAFSVSEKTAVIVLILYVFYHAIENYFIVPAVYGKRLRVSGFVVLVTLIAAYLLTGVEGAVAALPVVASYPIIERIWLKKFVGSATISEHSIQNGAPG